MQRKNPTSLQLRDPAVTPAPGSSAPRGQDSTPELFLLAPIHLFIYFGLSQFEFLSLSDDKHLKCYLQTNGSHTEQFVDKVEFFLSGSRDKGTVGAWELLNLVPLLGTGPHS